jgi:hypothetical protein
MSISYVKAANVKEGQTIIYGDTRVFVERISVAQTDGWIGIHANNDTWSTWFPPAQSLRVENS